MELKDLSQKYGKQCERIMKSNESNKNSPLPPTLHSLTLTSELSPTPNRAYPTSLSLRPNSAKPNFTCPQNVK